MAKQFYPLTALKSSVTASRNDLSKIRKVSEEVNRKVAAVSNKAQFSQTYIAEQTAKLRQEARQEAADYLTEQRTFSRFQQIQSQASHWTQRAYLLRGLAVETPALTKYDETGNTTALLKAVLASQRTTNALLSVGTLPMTVVAETFDAAILAGDMTLAAVTYGALLKAGEGGDDVARRSANRIEGESFPAVKEATDLIHEAAKIEEYLTYSLRSVADGSDDLGIRSQGYADLEASREQAQAEDPAERERYLNSVEVDRKVA